VLPIRRQAADDRLGLAGGLQLAGGHLVALHALRVRDIEIAVAQRDAGRAQARDHLLRFEAAVAVAVVHRHHAARSGRAARPGPAHQRDVDVAVRRHGNMPRRAEAVCRDDGAETRGERDAAIVGIARRRSAVKRWGERRGDACGNEEDRDERFRQ